VELVSAYRGGVMAYGGIWWHMVARNVRRHPAPFGSVTAL